MQCCDTVGVCLQALDQGVLGKAQSVGTKTLAVLDYFRFMSVKLVFGDEVRHIVQCYDNSPFDGMFMIR